MFRKFFIIIVLTLSLVFSCLAQNQSVAPTPSPTVTPTPDSAPQEDNEVLRVDTEEVRLSVRVIDSQKRPVLNLDKSQFSVYENDVLQNITSMTTAEVPIISTLVVDNSRSLRAQLAKIIDTSKILVNTNRPKDETSVVRFVSTDKIEVLQDFTTDKSLLNDALDNLFIEGGQTAVIDAVFETAKRVGQYQNSQIKDDARRRALIVVSDGDDRGSSRTEQELFELLRQSEVQIYVIGFVNNLSNERNSDEQPSRQEKAKAFLTRLAEETGGKTYFPNSIDDLPQIGADISTDLRAQYLLTYEPTSEARNRKFHGIKVVVEDGPNKQKRIAVTRTGRIAGSDNAPTNLPTTTQKPKNQ